MTAMASGRAAARPVVLDLTDLLRDMAGLLRGCSPAILLAWAALSAILGVGTSAGTWLKNVSSHIPAGQFVLSGIVIVATGFAQAFTLRLIAQDRSRWPVLDQAFLECAALFAFAQVASTGVSFVMAHGVGAGGDPRHSAPWRMLGSLASLALYYVYAKLMLYPIARLEGRRDISLAGAWRLMRRTVRTVVGAGVLMSIALLGPFVLVVSMLHVDAQHPPLAFTAFAAAIGGAMAILYQALAVAIWGRRVAATRDVAEVFD